MNRKPLTRKVKKRKMGMNMTRIMKMNVRHPMRLTVKVKRVMKVQSVLSRSNMV